MRVSVYKGLGEELAVLIEPSSGHRLHPVMLQNVTMADFKERVRAVVDDMRRLPGAVPP